MMVINERRVVLWSSKYFIRILFYAFVFMLSFGCVNWKKEADEWSHKLIDPFIFIIKTRVSSSENIFMFINFLCFIFVEVLWFFRLLLCIYFIESALLRFYVKRHWSILITVWKRSGASLVIIWYPGSIGNHIVAMSAYKENVSFVLDSFRHLISCETLSWHTKSVLLKLINIDSGLTMMLWPNDVLRILGIKTT